MSRGVIRIGLGPNASMIVRVENPYCALFVHDRRPCPVYQSLRIERALGPSCPLHSHVLTDCLFDGFDGFYD